MKAKKKILVWQMIILVVLFLGLITTMFMPALHYSGEIRRDIQNDYKDQLKDMKDEELDKMKEKAGDVSEKLFDDDSLLGGLLGGTSDIISDRLGDVGEIVGQIVGKVVENKINDELELTDDDVKKINDEIDDKEKEDGLKIRNITPSRIMSRGLERMIISDDAKEDELEDYLGEDYKDINSKYKTVRTLLIVVYIGAVIALILTVVCFAAGWSKIIPLIIELIFSMMTAGLFGYLRFGVMGKLGKKILELKFEYIPDKLSMEPFNRLYSYGLMVAFIVSIVIVVMTIVSLVIGKAEEVIDYDNYDYENNLYGENAGYNSEINETAAFVNEANYYDQNDSDEDAIPVTSASTEYVPPSPFVDQNQFFSAPPASAPAPTPVQPIFANPIPVDNRPMGIVRCTKGVLAGHALKLPEDRKVVVGKSPSKTNLTIGNPSISNVHCSIVYNAAKNTYKVKDHSTNGTFANGKRLPKETKVECPAGTVLSLADGSNEITLG